jgi:hypothetical protein
MIHTQASNDVHDYLAFLKCFPDAQLILHDARGATPEDVERFSSLVRYPLPTIYKGYLLHFGANDRGLDLSDDGISKVGELIQFYEEQISVGYWDVPVLGAVVALQGLTGGRALLYEEGLTDEPQVAINWGENVSRVVSESVRNWMYQTAFGRFRFRVKDSSKDFTSFRIPGEGKSVLVELAKICQDADLARYWFSDSYVHCAEGNNLYIRASATPTDASVMIGGSRSECTMMVAKIRRRFDVPPNGRTTDLR